MAFDYKKAYREFYLPPKTPGIVTVPAMNFLAVRGRGDPNEEGGLTIQALELLYGVALPPSNPFSLCGLNCALCSMHLGGYCPGCGGGAGNQSCAIARCSLEHGGIQFCWECQEYPCSRYDGGFGDGDSFVPPHRNRQQDIALPRRWDWRRTSLN